MDLYYDKERKSYVIKDGESTLVLSEEDFKKMRVDGKSPLLKKLWDSAKKERSLRKGP